jgi:hypothetical protein
MNKRNKTSQFLFYFFYLEMSATSKKKGSLFEGRIKMTRRGRYVRGRSVKKRVA